MIDSKLYAVLTHFDKIEQNRLRKYVRSPYFNINENLMSFLDIIFSHINKNKLTELTKEFIWADMFPNEAYNDVRFRKATSDLLKLIENFLAQEEYEKDNLQKASYLLNGIGNKKLEKLHNSAIKAGRDLIKQQHERTSKFYYSQYLIEKSYYSMSEEGLRRSEKINVEDIINNLDHFYLAEKLKWYNTVLSQKNLISHEYQLLFMEEIIQHIEKYNYDNIPAVLIYHTLYLLQTQSDVEQHYFDLKKLISQYWRQFSISEAEDIFYSLLNYCIKKLNQGNSFFLQEFLDVYKEILQKNILPNDTLNPWNFKNAVQIALRLGEIEWAEKFLRDYNEKLPTEFREKAVSFNSALVYFYQKKYKKIP